MIEAFATFKSRLELTPSFNEKIQARHTAVRSAIANIETGIETKLIGSLARKTRIQPRPGDEFDIDILIVRGTFTHWVTTGGITADQAVNSFLNTVQKSARYASKNPAPDKPTVSIPYLDDTTVELVPAYRDNIGHYSNGALYLPQGRAYWVPKSNGWELADYEFDARFVSDQNAGCGGWLIPTIKMLKAIKRVRFPEVPSFYFEMLATYILGSIIPSYKSSRVTITYPLLINNFFRFAGDWLNMPLSFPGSLTTAVSLNPVIAQYAKEMFASITQYCDAVEKVSSVREQKRHWRELIGDPFPSV